MTTRAAHTRGRFVVPTLIALVVLPLAILLLTIGARSPYTQANLSAGYDPNYTRTDQIVVGPSVPFVPAGLAVAASTDPVEHGRQLFVADGCSACHGLDGRGGVVGPSILNTSASKLGTRTHIGPGDMPPYAPGVLSEEDLAAIAAYLAAQGN